MSAPHPESIEVGFHTSPYGPDAPEIAYAHCLACETLAHGSTIQEATRRLREMPCDTAAEKVFDDHYAHGGTGLADDVWQRIVR